MVKPNPDHWIADEETRKRFWATVRDEYNLDSDDVHRLLGIKSAYEWEGTEQELYEALEEAGGE